MTAQQARLLFSTQTYEYLREELLKHDEFEDGKLEFRRFPDGERYMRIESDIENKEVLLVGGTISDTDTLQLYDLACALSKNGASKLTLIVPYFGYSTMERAVKPGEVVTAKTRARLLSLIPEATHGNHIVLLDLHVDGLQYYFEQGVVTKHLYGKEVILPAIRKYAPAGFVLGSTDAGRAKWVESLAHDLGVGASFVLKRRKSGSEVELAAVTAHVEGKHVCLYDDMIRSGSTLIMAAKAYRDAGATSVSAFATHGVFPEGALERIKSSGLFDFVVCTNSHPRAVQMADDFLKVVSVSELIVRGLSKGF